MAGILLTWQHAGSELCLGWREVISHPNKQTVNKRDFLGGHEGGRRSVVAVVTTRALLGGLCSGRFGCRVFLLFETEIIASYGFLRNRGFVSYPCPACRSLRNKPHRIQSAYCRHHLPAELYQIFGKSISRLLLTLAACPSCCLLERAVSAPLRERRERAQLRGEKEKVSEVSGLALLICSPRFSYLSAAWWKSSSPPREASVRAAACRPAWTGGSGGSLAAGVRCLWCVPSPAPRTGLAPASRGGGQPCCHPALVMSPDVPSGLGCSSSDSVFGVAETWRWAVEGEGEAVACGPWARSSPPGAEGPWGELGQVGGLGRWCGAGGRPALGQPPVWMGW